MATERVRVTLSAIAARGYDVVIGAGVLDAAALDLAPAGWLLITDDRVASLYGETVKRALGTRGSVVEMVVFAAGEASKTRDTAAALQDAGIAAGVGRDWMVAALGGGIAGDLGGFVAATLLRGLPLLALPTSLLAMVDSAVGGKTGVDTAAGKNLVGVFHQPIAAIADVETLATLPDAELSSGLAEVIKYGVIGDASLLRNLEEGLLQQCLRRDLASLQSVVARCVRQKAEVVAADEREQGRREILNFGHTVAHAIESVTGYLLRHGEAVAIGMVVEARLAARAHGGDAELPERLTALCRRAGLPVALPAGVTPEALIEAMGRDKKVRAGRIRCALPRTAGEMLATGAVPVSAADLRMAF